MSGITNKQYEEILQYFALSLKVFESIFFWFYNSTLIFMITSVGYDTMFEALSVHCAVSQNGVQARFLTQYLRYSANLHKVDWDSYILSYR